MRVLRAWFLCPWPLYLSTLGTRKIFQQHPISCHLMFSAHKFIPCTYHCQNVSHPWHFVNSLLCACKVIVSHHNLLAHGGWGHLKCSNQSVLYVRLQLWYYNCHYTFVASQTQNCVAVATTVKILINILHHTPNWTTLVTLSSFAVKNIYIKNLLPVYILSAFHKNVTLRLAFNYGKPYLEVKWR